MTNMVPYDRYGRIARSMFPFDMLDDVLSIPEAATADFKMDVEETDDGYAITAHVPGVKRDQIDVELNEGRLSVSVDKKDSDEEKAKNYIHKETTEYSSTRGVYLKDAATSGLTAKLADGILTVNVPKQQEKENVTKVSID
ncbi:MAG: Hsp20 family protein [Atopobiaceae bacterium]|jgi:HSP20 family protein|nr:Hsp20 family protein [Atopobiaceae bacterium]MCH4180657.1 Hsp20 family protein [Atopobiaceae bacterium]MCH4214674.1 Hsp20 family protein [Atopobiaceae bacterium]MCH4230595.1 Hsp20 family protein [Atopobiaceae bacterium]MCH4276720.1 Hsp20 family protein [Atopobiaceae bacterium]